MNTVYIDIVPKGSIDTCQSILKSGSYKGSTCGNKAKYELQGMYYCGTHVKPYTQMYDIRDPDTIIHPSVWIHTSTCGTGMPDAIRIDGIDDTEVLTISDISTLFSIEPRGQRVAGNGKKQVILPSRGKYYGYMVKGPWIDSIVPIMQCRLDVLLYMGGWILPHKMVRGEDNNIYSICRNVSVVPSNLWIYESCKDQYAYNPCTSEHGINVRIVSKNNLGITQLKDVNVNERTNILFGPQFMFHDILILNLLQVGDVSLDNIITFDDDGVRRGLITDYDELRSYRPYMTLSSLLRKSSSSSVSYLEANIKAHSNNVIACIHHIDSKLDEIKHILSIHRYTDMIDGYNIDHIWGEIRTLILQYV